MELWSSGAKEQQSSGAVDYITLYTSHYIKEVIFGFKTNIREIM